MSANPYAIGIDFRPSRRAATDPWRVSLGVEVANDRLELVVDESLSVVERTRP